MPEHTSQKKSYIYRCNHIRHTFIAFDDLLNYSFYSNANMRTKQSKITGMSGFASPQQRNNTHSVNLNVFIQNP